MGEFCIGGDEVVVMAGPCSAETEEQVEAAAEEVTDAGAKMFRGGGCAFKPRSSPYSFQGLGEEGLRMMRGACDRNNWPNHRVVPRSRSSEKRRSSIDVS